MKQICLALLFIALAGFARPAHAEVTEQDILDAILETRTFTSQELQEMDVNGDNQVDVADLVYWVQNNESDSTIGTRYVGTMSFDPKFALAPQSVDLTIDETGSQATFDVENSPFFPVSFKMNGSFSETMIRFDSQGSGVFPNGDPRNPLPKDISWNLSITEVTPVTIQDSDELMFQAAFTMTYTGFRSDDRPLDVTGTLYLKGQVEGEGLSFENADDMDLLVQKYPVQ